MNRGIPLALLLAVGAAGPFYLSACKKERVSPERTERPTPRATPSFCNELFDSAQLALAAALPSDRPCKASTDCVVVDTGACISDCGGAAIPKGGVDAVLAKRKVIENTTCKKYVDADCPSITPRATASCAVPSAVCRDGNCALKPWAPP